MKVINKLVCGVSLLAGTLSAAEDFSFTAPSAGRAPATQIIFRQPQLHRHVEGENIFVQQTAQNGTSGADLKHAFLMSVASAAGMAAFQIGAQIIMETGQLALGTAYALKYPEEMERMQSLEAVAQHIQRVQYELKNNAEALRDLATRGQLMALCADAASKKQVQQIFDKEMVANMVENVKLKEMLTKLLRIRQALESGVAPETEQASAEVLGAAAA